MTLSSADTFLSGSLEGAGGIGGLLARSHDFTTCNTALTVTITNDSSRKGSVKTIDTTVDAARRTKFFYTAPLTLIGLSKRFEGSETTLL